MRECPYFDNRGICLKPLLSIDENGMCSVPWYKGRRMEFVNESLEIKKEEIILDVDFKEINEKEDAEISETGENGFDT